MTQLQEECRYGLRTMGRNPGFTTVAVLTLALGIGANTAIFSLLDAVALRRLPVLHPEQLAEIQWTATKPANWQGYSSYTGCDAREGGATGADSRRNHSGQRGARQRRVLCDARNPGAVGAGAR